jgi:FKBP-type peptidyl-prolyl cis-trans isomerase (trigger factor)
MTATATVTIEYEATYAAVARVQEALDNLAATEARWNGATFEVKRGDFTHVDYSGPNHAEALMPVIYRAIDNK